MKELRLVPLSADVPKTISDAARSTSGSSVLVYQTDAGAIHASLRFARIRRMRIEFTLDVVNATDEPLLATVYAIAKTGAEIPVAPYALWIDRRTEAYLDLPVPLLVAFSCAALSVRLQGRNAHERLEAAIPRPSFPAWLAATAAIVVALVFAALSVLQPRILSFSLPASAMAGGQVSLSYAFSGSGAQEWELDDLSGTRVAGGPLSGSRGNATIPVPRVPVQSVYAFQLTRHGMFGHAAALRPIVVSTPTPAAPPPRISSFSLDNAQVPDGGAVTVRYHVSAQYGDVLASDAQGTIWAQQPLNASGVTVLQLPRFRRNKELQIRVAARRANAEISSGIGLMVIAPAHSATVSDDPPSRAHGSDVRVLDRSVTPGGELHLSVGDAASDVEVAFTRQDGTPLSGHIGLPAGSVTVGVPRSAKNLVVIVVTYRRGTEQDTIVKKMPVD